MGRLARRAALLGLIFTSASMAPLAAQPAATPAPATPAPAAQAVIPLAAHRAAYALTLKNVRDGGDITDARGAMVFEIADACEGWATHQRFSLTLTNKSGETVDTSSEYSTYEAKDGKSMRFSLVQSSQGAVSQRVAGEAELKADGSGTVHYTEPTVKDIALPVGTLLPMVHTARALATAREGKKIMVAPLFDGTGDDGAQDSTTIIASRDQAEPGKFPDLAKLASARIRIAFFDRDKQQGGASSPDYEVGMRYFDNGVANDLSMDFGGFVVDGKLEKLELLPSGC